MMRRLLSAALLVTANPAASLASSFVTLPAPKETVTRSIIVLGAPAPDPAMVAAAAPDIDAETLTDPRTAFVGTAEAIATAPPPPPEAAADPIETAALAPRIRQISPSVMLMGTPGRAGSPRAAVRSSRLKALPIVLRGDFGPAGSAGVASPVALPGSELPATAPPPRRPTGSKDVLPQTEDKDHSEPT